MTEQDKAEVNLSTSSFPPKPSVFQRLVKILRGVRTNIWTFLVFYFIFSLTHGIQGSYIFSVLSTLEKQFNLPSSLSSILVAISTLGYVASALFVSFFLAHKHHVRLFAFCMLITASCGFFYLLPHFIYKNTPSEKFNTSQSVEENIKSNTLMCYNTLNGNSSYTCNQNNNERKANDDGPNYVALALFSISEILQGVAGACLWTIGLTFIDDNMPVHRSSKLIGLMFFMRFMSPVISSALGSYFLSIPTDLKETSLTPKHPKWIGAWWLGFLVCSVINFSISIPTFFLPEKFDNVQHKNIQLNGNKEIINERNIKHIKTDDQQKIHNKSFRDLWVALKRLLKNPVYMFLSIGICFECYVLSFYAFLPKYFEVYFTMTAWMASLFGIMLPAISGGLGSYLGGEISGKYKLSLDKAVFKNMLHICFMTAATLTLIILIMLLQCPTNSFPHGYSDVYRSVQLNQSCNLGCSCPSDAFEPICDSDNQWYTSPCHAGCTQYDKSNGSTVFKNCSCINSEDQTAVSGYCDNSCYTVMIVYIIGLIVVFIVCNSVNVPVTNATLKCVDEEDKSLALGLQVILICVLVFPAPLIYGQLFDWVCILWKTSSCSDAVGSCLAYNLTSFKLILHGATAFWRFVAGTFYVIGAFFAWKKLKKLKLKMGT